MCVWRDGVEWGKAVKSLGERSHGERMGVVIMGIG